MKISIRTVADYITSTATKQRKVLFDTKYDKGEEAQAKIHYYQSALSEIKKFFRGSSTATDLLTAADKLEAEAAIESSNARASRMRNNARSIRDFERTLAAGFTCKILARESLIFPTAIPSVTLTANADLIVQYKGRKRYLRLDFSRSGWSDDVRKILAQGTFEAAHAADLSVAPGDVLIIHIATGDILKGARIGSRLRKEIDSTCANIAAIWPTL